MSELREYMMRGFMIVLLISATCISSPTAHAQQFQANRFEKDILDFEVDDKKHPPASGGTVFIGSSTFTLWETLETEFAKFKAINRGFGGSTLPDINNYVKRIVTKYHPTKIVLYAGTNDIAELNHTGEDVCFDFKKFVKLVRAESKDSDIYFISMSMAPSRVKFAKQYESGNECVKSFIKTQPHLHYIDVLPVMRNENGTLRKELFGFDNLHMNQNGYKLWTPLITKALDKHE